MAEKEGHALALEGVRAATLSEFLRHAGEVGSWAVADLSLGAWRGHQAAREVAVQLGVPPPKHDAAPPVSDFESDSMLSYADVVGQWIDEEGTGDRAVLEALDWARSIYRAAAVGPVRSFLVLAPRGDEPWQRENVLFIGLLARLLREIGGRVLLVSTGAPDPTIPAGWRVRWQGRPAPSASAPTESLLALVPGVLDQNALDRISLSTEHAEPILKPLDGGCHLVAPEFRPLPGTTSRLVFDRLALATSELLWLHAYAQFSGNHLYVDPYLLCGEAWKRHGEGGSGIAQRLLTRAISCAPTVRERAVLQSQLQGLRIGTRAYAAASEIEDPSPALPAQLRGFLLQTKGWGLAMIDRAAHAEPYLSEARELLSDLAGTREYLYLLNISALSRVKLGDLEGALELECRIADDLSQRDDRDWHMEYINCLNLARLERRRGNFEAASEFYGRAFATTLSLRTTSDAVYTNFCMAKLAENRGQSRDALSAWLRAALHWLASAAPQALAPRVVIAIVGRVPEGLEELETEVAAALRAGLGAAVAETGLPVSQDGAAPAFTHAARSQLSADQGARSLAVGAPGWSVILAPGLSASAPLSSPPIAHLRKFVTSVIRALCAAAATASFDRILVDDRFGIEVPRTPAELVGVCLRHGVRRIAFDMLRLELNPNRFRELELDTRIQVAPGVDELRLSTSPCSVGFKRYRPERVLSQEEALLLSRLDRPRSIRHLEQRSPSGLAPAQILSTARALEHARVVECRLPETAVLALDEG